MITKQKVMFLEVAKCFTKITSMAKVGAKLERDIQEIAMSAILHANTEGDNNADIGIKLVKAMPAATRKTSLINYLCTHGNFKYEDSVLTFERKSDVVSNPEQLFAILSSNHWTKAVKEADPESILDAGKRVKMLVKSIQKAIADKREINWASDDSSSAKLASLIRTVLVEGAEINVVDAPAPVEAKEPAMV